MSGCQTRPIDNITLSKNQHVSHGVYEVELDSARLFRDESKKLTMDMQSYCDGEISRIALQGSWFRVMSKWMAIQGQGRGPEAALAQSWNIQLWPDKKNTTGRKMRAIFSSSKSWSQEEIANQSVAVQGVGAIEWLLFDQSSPLTREDKTCKTAVAITENLAINAQEIGEAWEINPWSDLDEQQWYSEYISVLSNQLSYSLKKMTLPLAKFGHPRPYFSESWRSQASLQNLKSNILAMQRLYLAGGNGLDKVLRDKGNAYLADRIVRQFEFMIDTWPSEESLFELVQSKSGYQNVYSQFNKLEHLQYLIHEEVAVELGVIIGFNSTDGD
ncbi:imelysin family protein [Vibrio caribbeanicus]|nr:imelysin family protein [Vibrio caribbeanicus]MCY9843095.1 imelysin family protein [Vibrio caribbeanicus]